MIIDILRSPQRLLARIEARAYELEEMRAMACSVGGGQEMCSVNGERQVMDRVQSSKSGGGMPDAVIRVIEREQELDDLQRQYDRALRMVDQLLAPLDPRAYRIMHALYVEGRGVRETADMLGYSRQTVSNAKTEAIATLERLEADETC